MEEARRDGSIIRETLKTADILLNWVFPPLRLQHSEMGWSRLWEGSAPFLEFSLVVASGEEGELGQRMES